MKLCLGTSHWCEEDLDLARQLGIEYVSVVNPDLLGDGYWEYADLLRLRMSIEDAGLKLAAIESMPRSWYHKVWLGLPGRDEQIENWCKTLENMGRAGVRLFGYAFNGSGIYGSWRSSTTTRGRGGSRVTSFSAELVKDAPVAPPGRIGDEELWDNFAYFLKAVIPAAEKAGVRMALHPDDPQVPTLAGRARIFRDFEAFERAVKLVPSDYNGLEFCQGCFSQMGEDPIRAIRHFGSRNKIFHVHFRDVVGGPDNFVECFIDEGQTDMLKAMEAYRDVGYEGAMRPDHVPSMSGDVGRHIGRAYAIGYMKALVKACGVEG